MANHKSAEKGMRQTEKRTEINKARRGKLRTFIKKVEEAILGGNKDAAAVAFKEAQPVIMSSSQKGIIHKNTVARKLSRLSARIKKMGA